MTSKEKRNETIIGLIKEARPLNFKLWAAQVLTENLRQYAGMANSEEQAEFSRWAEEARAIHKEEVAITTLILALMNEAGMKDEVGARAKDKFIDKYTLQVGQLTDEEESSLLKEFCGYEGTADEFVKEFPSSPLTY